MRFIDNEDGTVQVQLVRMINQDLEILANFKIEKEYFEEFLDHVIVTCKSAYNQDELFS